MYARGLTVGTANICKGILNMLSQVLIIAEPSQQRFQHKLTLQGPGGYTLGQLTQAEVCAILVATTPLDLSGDNCREKAVIIPCVPKCADANGYYDFRTVSLFAKQAGFSDVPFFS